MLCILCVAQPAACVLLLFLNLIQIFYSLWDRGRFLLTAVAASSHILFLLFLLSSWFPFILWILNMWVSFWGAEWWKPSSFTSSCLGILLMPSDFSGTNYSLLCCIMSSAELNEFLVELPLAVKWCSDELHSEQSEPQVMVSHIQIRCWDLLLDWGRGFVWEANDFNRMVSCWWGFWVFWVCLCLIHCSINQSNFSPEPFLGLHLGKIRAGCVERAGWVILERLEFVDCFCGSTGPCHLCTACGAWFGSWGSFLQGENGSDQPWQCLPGQGERESKSSVQLPKDAAAETPCSPRAVCACGEVGEMHL